MAEAHAAEVAHYEHVCKLAIASLDRRKYDERREGYLHLFANFPAQRAVDVEFSDGTFEVNDRRLAYRMYVPRSRPQQAGCIVYAHGGGFVSGNLEVCHGIGSELAHDLNVCVFTFEYALSPELPFPQPVEDCYEAVRFLQRQAPRFNIDPERIVFAGESCGGNFGPAVALMLRDRAQCQLGGIAALNPVFDVHRWASGAAKDGTSEFRAEMQYFTSSYLAKTAEDPHAYASPLRAQSLKGLPRTFIWAAGLDPLRLEATAFRDRLIEAGVDVVLRIKPGVVHGCVRARHYYAFAEEAYMEMLDGFRFVFRLPRQAGTA